MVRGFMLGAATALSLAAATPAHAVIELQWWHAMTGGNNDVVNKLADDFNASQSEYKVVPSFKGSYADTMNAGIAAFRAGNAPHIMQVFEVGTATMMSATGAIKPVYQLMKDAGEPFDPKAYLPTITGYYSTSKGDMLSFPFNSSSMVMWINKDELKKDKTYDYGGRANAGEARFGSGECAIFLTSSGYYGTAKGTAKFDFTSAPMPYYPDVANAPQNSIIGGASLWVMGGKKPEEYK